MAEITSPESDKFTAALVLLHGLWDQPAGWRRFAGYLAHRGWRCIALARSAQLDTLEAVEAEVRDAIAALDAPPILVGHDVGANVALRCVDRSRAVVALAPLVGPPLAEPSIVLQGAGTWLERWRGDRLHAPRVGYPSRQSTEPAALVHTVTASAARPIPASDVPRVVFAMEVDEVTPLAATRRFAEQCGAPLQVIGGAGHAALAGAGWEACVAAAHRWIIRELGVDLLALYDEAWEGREKP